MIAIHRPVNLLLTLIALGFLEPLVGAVAVTGSNGARLIGAAVEETDDHWRVRIYHSFHKELPKDAVASIEPLPDPLAATRQRFDTERQALAPADLAGGIALARRAWSDGLSIQATRLLHALQASHPDDRSPTATLAELRQVTAVDDLATARQRGSAFLQKPYDSETRKQLRQADRIEPAWIDELQATLWQQRRAEGPTLTDGDNTLEHPLFTGTAHVERWAKDEATAAEAGAWPVVISLHGGGQGSGDWTQFGKTCRKLFRQELDRFIFLAPNVLQQNYAEWAGNPLEELWVLELLDACKRSWPVDCDRVYLAGYSMGGYGTWHIGGHQADRFAGLASGAGGILIGTGLDETWGWGIIGNLRHTRTAFAHGGKDRPSPPWSDQQAATILTELAAANPDRYPHRFLFYDKKGHGLPGAAMREAVGWITDGIRQALPRDITWEPKRPLKHCFHWLAVDQPRCFTRIEARLEDNRIDLQLTGIDGGLSILLNEKLVDLDLPIEVRLDGERLFQGLARPSLSALAESIAWHFDPAMIFTHRIDL